LAGRERQADMTTDDDDDMMPGTLTRLVRDLRCKPDDGFRDEMIAAAEAGRWHDYRSPLGMPKIALDAELRRAGYEDLSRRCRQGDYDDEPSDADRSETAQLMMELGHPDLAEKFRRGEPPTDEEMERVAAGLDGLEAAVVRSVIRGGLAAVDAGLSSIDIDAAFSPAIMASGPPKGKN